MQHAFETRWHVAPKMVKKGCCVAASADGVSLGDGAVKAPTKAAACPRAW
jgi:hypothetical protein